MGGPEPTAEDVTDDLLSSEADVVSKEVLFKEFL